MKRDEILDVGQKLIYTQGYEQMTIQSILDELQIAKGTFYHYFASKQDLLEAIVQRITEQGIQIFLPIVRNNKLSAIEKLQTIFDSIGVWKTKQKEIHLSLLRVWYSDDNAIVRWKMRLARGDLWRPLFTEIIQQGVREGTLNPIDSQNVDEVVLSLLHELMDSLSKRFLEVSLTQDNSTQMLSTVDAYTRGLERVLGIQHGILSLVDAQTLEAWRNALVDRDGLNLKEIS